MIETVRRARYRVGERRRRLALELEARPLRVRTPLFSLERELRRIEARYARGDRPDGWTSHQPVLLALLRALPGARVLELGVGYGSTPIVAGLSGSSVSLETSETWFARFARFGTDEHSILLWRDFDEDEWRCPYFDEEWDVAILDNAPGRSRQRNLEQLAPRTRFVVCHDAEEVLLRTHPQYGWDFSAFPYVWTYTRAIPYTAVVSAREPIPDAVRRA